MHWTEAEYRDYKARVQLPLGRDVKGLERPKRVNTCAMEWQEAERLIAWADGEGGELWPEVRWLYAVPNGGFRHKAVATARGDPAQELAERVADQWCVGTTQWGKQMRLPGHDELVDLIASELRAGGWVREKDLVLDVRGPPEQQPPVPYVRVVP